VPENLGRRRTNILQKQPH